jgi:hypothetical protein
MNTILRDALVEVTAKFAADKIENENGVDVVRAFKWAASANLSPGWPLEIERALRDYISAVAVDVAHDIENAAYDMLEAKGPLHFPAADPTRFYDGPASHDDWRDRITAAFKELRSLGLMARQGVSTSWSHYSTTESNPDIWGVTWYDSDERKRRDEHGHFFLAYGSTKSLEDALDDGETKMWQVGTTAVGHVVTAVLAKHGVPFEWGGSPAKSIEVHAGIIAQAMQQPATRRW